MTRHRPWKRLPIGVLLAMILAGCATTAPVEEAAAPEPPPVQAEIVAAGDRAARRGDYFTALGYYRNAAELAPESDTWLRVAAAAERIGNDAEAAMAFERALELAPDDVDARLGVGLHRIRQKDFEGAHPHLARAAELDPTRWRTFNALGIVADHRGQESEAIGFYASAAALNPESAMVRNNLGYARMRGGDAEASEDDFKLAIRLDPTFEPPWYNLARLYAERGRYREALQLLLNVSAPPKAYHSVATVALEQSDLDVAETYFREAIAASPTYFEEAHLGLQQLASLRRE